MGCTLAPPSEYDKSSVCRGDGDAVLRQIPIGTKFDFVTHIDPLNLINCYSFNFCKKKSKVVDSRHFENLLAEVRQVYLDC